ncbi:hypothetical protein FQA39_LY11787 [Lamprigera yunnana]|nr:hypothetical protein FQA39_LY11787 [Lamprigera yunnana]
MIKNLQYSATGRLVRTHNTIDKQYNMTISTEKTKCITTAKEPLRFKIEIVEKVIKQEPKFRYLTNCKDIEPVDPKEVKYALKQPKNKKLRDRMNDGDLVFENNLDESPNNNQHLLAKRNLKSLESSQPSEDDHWLSRTVKRFKRQLLSSSWFGGTEDNSKVRQRRSPQGQAQLSHAEKYDFEENNEIGHDQPHGQGETDDEDDLDNISGSGAVDNGYEPVVPGQPVYYRITMAVFEPFIEPFNDRNSPEYKEISGNLVTAVNTLYESFPGRQSAAVIRLQKREADVFSSKVTMDLGTVDYYDHGRIRNHLYSHIRNYHSLGQYKVTTDEFTFRKFEGSHGLPQCQPDELPCHSGECVPVAARCNNKYECRDQSDEAGCDLSINEVDIRPTYATEQPSKYPATPEPPLITELSHTTKNPYEPETTFTDDNYERQKHTPSAGPEATTHTPHPITIVPPLETTTEHLLVSIFNKLYNITGGSTGESDEGSLETTPVYNLKPSGNKCRADDVVRCGDGSTVICADQFCDGIKDCPGGEDEQDCPSGINY